MVNFTFVNNVNIFIGASLERMENLNIKGRGRAVSGVTFQNEGGGANSNVKLHNVHVHSQKFPKQLNQLQIIDSEISKMGLPQLADKIEEIIIEDSTIESIFDLGLSKFTGNGTFKNNKMLSSCQTPANKDEACFVAQNSNIDYSNNFLSCKCPKNKCEVNPGGNFIMAIYLMSISWQH